MAPTRTFPRNEDAAPGDEELSGADPDSVELGEDESESVGVSVGPGSF